ncbi:MAG: acyltransferase family protein [Bacteroides sp.]|nr:acyltransferase family protein [Bacillota bacterium]MCM1394234.1 acyltransferase family protein [[Eubacterium] siraeum]MCM1455995.1 acyltransferase family protein [Bacteroides sp.]
MNNAKGRIDWIDIAKGITILTVIIGHTCGGALRGIIFSFHMPIFFILSAITFKYSRDNASFKANFKKSFIHLIIPAIALFFISLAYDICLNPNVASVGEFWRNKLYMLVFASGVKTNFDNVYVPALGMPWFLFALFIGRNIFDFLQMKFSRHTLIIICTVSSLIGVIFGITSHWLPFSLDVVLAIMPFFYFGYYLKTKPKNYNAKSEKTGKSILRLTICLIIWIFTFYLTTTNSFTSSYLELAIRRYPLFPICYVCAISATLAIAEISKLLSKLKEFIEPLKILGKNSLYLYILHSIDGVWKFLWDSPNGVIGTLNKVAVDLILFIIVLLAVNLIGKWILQINSKNDLPILNSTI